MLSGGLLSIPEGILGLSRRETHWSAFCFPSRLAFRPPVPRTPAVRLLQVEGRGGEELFLAV